jgi:hypothetical protein
LEHCRRNSEENWPESELPVNTEEIVEFRLRLNIEPVLSTIDIDAYLKVVALWLIIDVLYERLQTDAFSLPMNSAIFSA